jgi:hypothetical protein
MPRPLVRIIVVTILALGFGSCKKHDDDAPTSQKRDAAAVEVDWTRCENTLRKVPTLPDAARTAALLEGCQVCGDWTPLLRWNTLHEQGGPTRTEIDERMAACHAYCDSNARQRFLGTLDDARGTPSRAPWRYLGEICKDQVSAVPDGRYVSAPYLALDRIARAATARGGELAALVANVDLPLPALSLTGSGIELPDLASTELEIAPAIHVTVLGDGAHVGKLPRAHLSGHGVIVDYGGEPYPGPRIAEDQLAPAVRALDPSPHAKIALFAPRGLPAGKLEELFAKAPGLEPHAAALAPVSPPGWPLPAIVRTPLVPAK